MNAERPSIVRTLDQQRAAHAWQQVSGTKKLWQKDKEKQDKLKSLARSAPASIQSNGLGQTVAFWKAKNEDHHAALYTALQGWLKEQLKFSNSLLEWIATEATSAQYRHATAEALAYLNWYKRFAEAELEGE
ncbi:MAG: type III-B CRISPR module-associated protein Cmr5 [Chloroflexota bacterium]